MTHTYSPEVTAPNVDAPTVNLHVADASVQVIELTKSSTDISFSRYLQNSIATSAGVAALLEGLSAQRESWERTELAASRTRLYAILTECYEFYLALKSATTAKGVRKQLADGLDSFIKTQGLRTLAKTHEMNKVVKAVFGEDRRRVSAYAMALRAALVAGPEVNAKTTHVPANELAAWIEKKGGVEEIRLGSKNSGLTEKERAEKAQAALEDDEPLMTIKPDAKAMQFSADDADRKMVLLVTYRPTGELEINCVVKHDNVVRAALAAHYADNKEQMSDASPIKVSRQTAVASALSE